MTCRVLLADAHQLVLDGLCAILEKHEEFMVAGQVRDGLEAVETARDLKPDIFTTGISLQGLNGIEAARRIKSQNPRTKILCLSTQSRLEIVEVMLRAGASGYVLKQDSQEELLNALRNLISGRSFISPRVAHSVVTMVRSDRSGDSSFMQALTAREREVLQLLAEGFSSRNIAARLKVSIRTVGSHRESLKQKLDLHNIADLTRFAIRQGLTSL